MIYISEIKALLGPTESIYDRTPAREEYTGRPLTKKDRLQVERKSYPDRGYRRLVAEQMGWRG